MISGGQKVIHLLINSIILEVKLGDDPFYRPGSPQQLATIPNGDKFNVGLSSASHIGI